MRNLCRSFVGLMVVSVVLMPITMVTGWEWTAVVGVASALLALVLVIAFIVKEYRYG